MAYLSKVLVIISFVVLTDSCKTANTQNAEKHSTDKRNMLSKGFQEASLELNSSDGCPVLLIMGEEQLDPINLSDFTIETPSEVWVKFGRLRIKNRCDAASPVKIEAIEKR